MTWIAIVCAIVIWIWFEFWIVSVSAFGIVIGIVIGMVVGMVSAMVIGLCFVNANGIVSGIWIVWMI